MKYKSSLFVRLVVVILLMLGGFGESWASSKPAQASPVVQADTQGGGEVRQELIATVGEPFIPNQVPEGGKTTLQPTGKSTPNLDSPVAPPDPQKQPQPQSPPIRPDDYWEIPMSEDFEGAFPNGLWNAFDNNGATYGEYFWDDDDFKPHPPTPPSYWSAWPANGGANGVDPQSNNYANDMDSWLMYAPFDLSNCAAADYDFYYWNKSEPGFDYFGWAASPNGSNFYGSQLSGDQSSWNYVDF